MPLLFVPSVSNDLLPEHLRLAGLLQARRSPNAAVPDAAVPFRTVLLEQVRGVLDRSSLSLSEGGLPQVTVASPWDPMLTFAQARSQAGAGGPAVHPPIRRTAKLVRGYHLTRSAQPPRNLPAHPSGLVEAASSQGLGRPVSGFRGVPEPGSVPPKATAPEPYPAGSADRFLRQLGDIAKATAEKLGLSPHLLLAQAALETGWGRRSIKDAQGQESHNLFGLKAGRRWAGKTVEVKTTEFIQGIARQKVETFRAYDSFVDAFADYAKLIKQRYGEAMGQGAAAAGFGQALQAKGYATDPNYAIKIARVAQSVAYRLNSLQA